MMILFPQPDDTLDLRASRTALETLTHDLVAALDGSLDAAARARLTAAVAQICETIGAEVPTPEGKGWFDDE